MLSSFFGRFLTRISWCCSLKLCESSRPDNNIFKLVGWWKNKPNSLINPGVATGVEPIVLAAGWDLLPYSPSSESTREGTGLRETVTVSRVTMASAVFCLQQSNMKRVNIGESWEPR